MKIRALTTMTAMAAGLLLGGGTAVAGPANIGWLYTDDGNPGGKAFFEDRGDELYVCDIQEDGYGAVAYLQHRNGRYLLEVRDPRPSDGCYYVENSNIAENQSVRVLVCLYRNGINDYCDESSFGSTG